MRLRSLLALLAVSALSLLMSLMAIGTTHSSRELSLNVQHPPLAEYDLHRHKPFKPFVSNGTLRMFIVSALYDDRWPVPAITVHTAMNGKSKFGGSLCELSMRNGSSYTVPTDFVTRGHRSVNRAYRDLPFNDRTLKCVLQSKDIPVAFRFVHLDSHSEWIPVALPRNISDQVVQCSTSPLRLDRYKDSLVEYIEYHRLQGISRFVIYTLDHDSHPEADKILDYYASLDIVEKIRWGIPTCKDLRDFQEKIGDTSPVRCSNPRTPAKERIIHNYGQWVASHDCLLQYSRAEFVALMDLDEYFFSASGATLPAYVEGLYQKYSGQVRDRNQIAGFTFYTRYYHTRIHRDTDTELVDSIRRKFLPEALARHRGLVSITAEKEYSYRVPKSVVRPREVLRTISHFPHTFFHTNYSSFKEIVDINKAVYHSTSAHKHALSFFNRIILVDPQEAHLHHVRYDLEFFPRCTVAATLECKELVHDPRLFNRYAQVLTSRTRAVFQELEESDRHVTA